MWRLPRISYLVTRLSQVNISDVRCCYSQMLSQPSSSQTKSGSLPSHQEVSRETPKHYIGENLSRKDRTKFLLTTLRDIDDNKEAIYGALDAWVAWEQNFPIGSLRNILLCLEKEQQWHRIVQVIKWMLSKGQGTTMGTYGQLIRALDMDHRVEEAHKFWEMKIGTDLHSVPWQLCHLMISVYYRNNMLEDLVKLFKGLESFDRKPRDKLSIQKVANAYEMLGLVEEKERIMEKYSHLFIEEGPRRTRKGGRKSSATKKKVQPSESRKDSEEK
ncbi:pentatricopeptide repeat-containing protein, chloroplastic [Trifolium repens]|nr:pentatricopeptide repeat-containing protein, chloroplastic [Trifolium repens]